MPMLPGKALKTSYSRVGKQNIFIGEDLGERTSDFQVRVTTGTLDNTATKRTPFQRGPFYEKRSLK